MYTKDEIFPIRPLAFEDVMIDFPNKIEDILKRNYGNFMQVPPPEKRKNHRPLILKFPEDNNPKQ